MDTTGTSGYRALRAEAAWMDLSARGKLRATGDDRARLLHAMTTQQVEAMQPGDGCYTFFLNAQGRILGDAHLLCRDDSIWIDTEPKTRQKLFEHIDRYIIADDVTLEDITEQFATIAIEGPAAGTVLDKLGGPAPASAFGNLNWGDRVVARISSTGAGGFFVLLPSAAKDQLIAELGSAGVPKASEEDARTVRIENGRPRYGDEITERYLVQETGQLHAVNFNKGCYLGQEIVERVRSRAQIHRVLRRLEISALEAPVAGSKLKSGDADAGEIVSAVFSPALQRVSAMAYVRTPSAEAGTQLEIGGALARVL